MPQLELTEPLLVGIRYIQLIFATIFLMGLAVGIFMFIYAFKNPMKKRLAYVLCVSMPIGFIITLYGPVFLLYYVFDSPKSMNASEGFYVFEPFLNKAGSFVYELYMRLLLPLLVVVTWVAIAILHHASRIPGRKRIGYGILLGVPILWILSLLGPAIRHLLVS